MTRAITRSIIGLALAVTMFALLAPAQQMPRTTREQIPGAPTAKTEELTGTVVMVEGNKLVVRMSGGDIRAFDVPASRRFNIDGKEVTVNELTPGTKLKATITTTTTPIVERTTTVGTGKVWYVSGNTVILTLPNGENRTYKVKPDYRFNVNGQKASVSELRKGMTVSAERIVEEPRTEIATNTVVVGEAPPKTEVARAPAPAPAPAPEPARAPEPAPVEQAAAPPAKLPTTASPLPLTGLAGLGFLCASLVVRRLRRG